MQLRKYRWSKAYESAEEELVDFLMAKNIKSERWSAEAGEIFLPHKHPLDKQLFCAEGGIVFTINARTISLQAGDALDLPAGTVHEGKVGLAGCVCYESPPLADNPTLPTTTKI